MRGSNAIAAPSREDGLVAGCSSVHVFAVKGPRIRVEGWLRQTSGKPDVVAAEDHDLTERRVVRHRRVGSWGRARRG